MRNYLWIALIAAALAGCSSTPTTEAPVDDRSATAGAGGAGSAGAQTGGATGGGVTGSAVGAGGGNPLRDPNNILSKRSVYFDFDSFVVKDEYRPLVEAHSRDVVRVDSRAVHVDPIAVPRRDVDIAARKSFASDLDEDVRTTGFEQDRGFGHGCAANTVLLVEQDGAGLTDQ